MHTILRTTTELPNRIPRFDTAVGKEALRVRDLWHGCKVATTCERGRYSLPTSDLMHMAGTDYCGWLAKEIANH